MERQVAEMKQIREAQKMLVGNLKGTGHMENLRVCIQKFPD